LHPDLVSAMTSSLSSSEVQHEPAHQVPVTSGPMSMHESSVVDSASSLSLDVTGSSSVFLEASKTSQPVVHHETGAGGDGPGSTVVKGSDVSDACCDSPLFQSAGLQHIGGGDDLATSPVALLSNQTDAQLQELLRQQQWHVRLNQMMQLDMMHHHSQAPLVIGADTAASLLWHQQQQQHITNPTAVSFAFCNDQVPQQQQQVLLQHQQPQTTVEMKYDVQQQPVQMKPSTDSQQGQSPRQQKPRLIARGSCIAL